MNQSEAQAKYADLVAKIKTTDKPWPIGMAIGLERLRLQNDLNHFRLQCLELGVTLLEPCPFCGGYDVKSVISEYLNNMAWVECLNCEAEGPSFKLEATAIAAWNNRVS